MLILAFVVVIFSFLVATSYSIRTFPERLFCLVFTISTVYYGILGPWYWEEFQGASFLGIYWGESFPLVVFSFVFVYLLVLATISCYGTKTERLVFSESSNDIASLKPTLNFLFIVGLVASCYAYFVGGSLLENDLLLTDDAFLNISLQFSDVLIGSLLFWIATKGVDKKWLVISSLFVLYVISIGFRSKLIVWAGPILIYIFFQPRKNIYFVRASMILLSLLMVALFSIMTISRVKFSGLDLDVLADAGIDVYLYGLFAETNVIFGLSSCFHVFGETVPYAFFEPFTDVLVQFVPRFMYHDKHLYQHLVQVGLGLANAEASASAGTAMPFFGEYYSAFGWIGMVIFVVLYTLGVLYMINFIRRYSVTKSQYLMGVALIAVFFGYYYFSRGSIAQIFKGFVFACGPYFYLLKLHARNVTKLKLKAITLGNISSRSKI